MGNMMTSPPEGGKQAPQLRPILRWACAAFGLAYPHADKRRGAPQAMPAASCRARWRSMRPAGR